MRNIFWLIPDRLAGRPGPTQEPWSLAELRAGGFDSVLNLSQYEPCSAEFVNAGLEVTWVPLPTTVPPDQAAEQACFELLPVAHQFLSDQLKSGRRVLVHCVVGRDRTGMLLAYHIARSRGLPAATAIEHVREVRPNALAAAGWERMAERVISKLLAAG